MLQPREALLRYATEDGDPQWTSGKFTRICPLMRSLTWRATPIFFNQKPGKTVNQSRFLPKLRMKKRKRTNELVLRIRKGREELKKDDEAWKFDKVRDPGKDHSRVKVSAFWST